MKNRIAKMLSPNADIDLSTQELVAQDQMLWTINQISKKLLAFQPDGNFDSLVQDCLKLLGENLDENRIYIWKDRTDKNGRIYCTQIYEWVHNVLPIQGHKEFGEIPYDDLPAFAHAIIAEKCLNSLIRDLSASERRILEPQGIKTILIAPIAINGNRWGFIGVDNCKSEKLFSIMEEHLLLMSGSMIANTIEKMETEAKLREAEERSQLMLNAMPLCCNLWTPDFLNMSCNDEAVRLFGLASQNEYLERFHELSPIVQPCGEPSDLLAIDYIRKAFEEGFCHFEWLHQKPDGTPLPAEITLVRIKYQDTFIVAGYTRDLREQKAMLAELHSKEQDLRTARDEALLNSKAKSNFLANMSHEIRTPMNAISGLAEIILNEPNNNSVTEHAKGIKNACVNLLNIINDILDISKIESGKLEIINAPYEFSSLLNDVISISRMRLGSKPLMFITDIDSRLPSVLFGDEIRIKQIMINLLSNAIKFTPEGHIALRVSAELDGTTAMLHISVSDSGLGVKAEDMNLIFAEFERVNTTKNRNIEGTGLGLAISKQLCEMMGGTISVESTYGEGSVFSVTIPQQCPDYQRLAEVCTAKSVLLYEPRERYRLSIKETLENLDCRCIPCANQSELYDNIHAMAYDYILTPCLHLKKVLVILDKKKLTTPVAAFADYGESTVNNTVPTILFPVNCLQLSSLLNDTYDNSSTSHSDSSVFHFIAPSASILIVDDNPVNLQVAEGLMKPHQFQIDTAVNGADAVTMVQQNAYDLVFMDHMMPVMDGIDATIAIRQLDNPCYKTLPIIALTANALVGTREMFIYEGMNDFLAKPIDVQKLYQLLLKWLPQSKIIKSSPKDTAKIQTDVTHLEIEGIHTEQGIRSVGGNIDNYLHILSTFYEDGKQKTASLLHHLTKKDPASFRTEIHAIKSTSATIGALKLSSIAEKLEAAAQIEDFAAIDRHIDSFLTDFNQMLQSIWSFLVTKSAENADTVCCEQPSGDTAHLRSQLDSLYDAADFANITLLEELMRGLLKYRWPEAIEKILLSIQEHLVVFDYDGILESVLHLKELP